MKIDVLVEQAEMNWAASSSDDAVQGCVAVAAETREAAIAKFREALAVHLDYLRQIGRKVPQVDELELRELISA